MTTKYAVLFPARSFRGLPLPVLHSEHARLTAALATVRPMLSEHRHVWVERWTDEHRCPRGRESEEIVAVFHRRAGR